MNAMAMKQRVPESGSIHKKTLTVQSKGEVGMQNLKWPPPYAV